MAVRPGARALESSCSFLHTMQKHPSRCSAEKQSNGWVHLILWETVSVNCGKERANPV